MKEKTETCKQIRQFLIDWKSMSSDPLIRLRTDNGTEFMNKDVQDLLAKNMIRHETSTPYVPQQNGTIERAMRTVVEAARSMIYGSDTPVFLWSEAVACAVHTLNRIPAYEGNKSPYEIVTGNKPDISYFREFGSPAFVHVRDQDRTKWQPKSKKMTFVGYNGTNSYRLWDHEKQRIVHSRDVTIVEQDRRESPLHLPVDDHEERHEDHDHDDLEHDHDEDHEDQDNRDSEGDHDEHDDRESDPPTPPARTSSKTRSPSFINPDASGSGMNLRPQVRKDYRVMQQNKGYKKKQTPVKVKVVTNKHRTHEINNAVDFASYAVDGPASFEEAIQSEDRK